MFQSCAYICTCVDGNWSNGKTFCLSHKQFLKTPEIFDLLFKIRQIWLWLHEVHKLCFSLSIPDNAIATELLQCCLDLLRKQNYSRMQKCESKMVQQSPIVSANDVMKIQENESAQFTKLAQRYTKGFKAY